MDPRVVMYRSNRVEVLAHALSASLEAHRPASPITPMEVVVGSRGMEHYLRQVIADQLGICANIGFPFPSSALERLLPAACAHRGSSADPWSPDRLAWTILGVLPEVAAHPQAEPLLRYLGAAEEDPLTPRRWALARMLADLLDRYITYRPDLVAAWTDGRPAPGDAPEDAWQAILWQAVRQALAGVPHRAERIAHALTLPPEPGEPWRIFGVTHLPPAWLELLHHTAAARRVEVYHLAPSGEWWADLHGRRAELPPLVQLDPDDVGRELVKLGGGSHLFGDAAHPLLTSWGRVARDAQLLVESILPDYLDPSDACPFIDPATGSAPTLLQWLQHDLAMGAHPASEGRRDGWEARALSEGDRSVQLHLAHGPMRQVEVLREALLACLDEDPTLQPRDIVVMTPDVEAYAPLVTAVFSDGAAVGSPEVQEGGAPARLPVVVADRAVRRVNPVAQVLLVALDMADGRVRLSEMLDVLALPPLVERFGLSADDLARAQAWWVEAGVRWGEEASRRAAHGQPQEHQNTWRFGLERLLLGSLMPDEGLDPEQTWGIRPVDVGGGDSAASLGRLVGVVTCWFSWLDQVREPRSPSQWSEVLAGLVADLTPAQGHNVRWRSAVLDTLVALAEDAGSFSSKVSLPAVRRWLEGRFDAPDTGRRGAGAVTLCGMVPERAIPYRVVCLLGMDEGSFPRVSTRPSFDRMSRNPRVGDRSSRDEDRFLLLEALLSARDRLVITWAGRHPRTNEERPPAVPISELLDALDATVPWSSEQGRPSVRCRIEHPLQAFDPSLFDGTRFRSFDGRLAGILGGSAPPPPPLLAAGLTESHPADPGDTLTVDELLAFWRHPVRAWMRSRLGLNLPWDGDGPLPDREPLSTPSRVWRAGVGEVLGALLHGRPESAAVRALVASGEWPAGGLGEQEMARLRHAASSLAQALTERGFDPVAGRDRVDVDLADVRLRGQVIGRCGEILVQVESGAPQDWQLIPLWIRWLALVVSGHPVTRSVIIGFDTNKDQVASLGLDPSPDVDPSQALARLLRAWRAGQDEPLPLFPKASFQFARRSDDERAIDAALAAWFGGFRSVGESQDRWLRHAFGASPPFIDSTGGARREFASLAREVLGPIWDARVTDKVASKWRVS